MVSWKKWMKIFYIIPVTFLFNINELVSDRNDIPVSDMLVQKIYSNVTTGNDKAFILVMEKLFFLFFFNLLFGNYIYEDFRICSVYVFSRLRNRKKWYVKKFFDLIIFSVIYTFLLLISYMLLSVIRTGNQPDVKTISVFFQLIYMISIILCVSTACINLLSLRLGNTFSFIVVYTVEIILVLLAINHHSIPFLEGHAILQRINPFYGIVLNSQDDPIFQVLILGYYSLYVVLLLFYGSRYINKIDVALEDHEKA